MAFYKYGHGHGLRRTLNLRSCKLSARMYSRIREAVTKMHTGI